MSVDSIMDSVIYDDLPKIVSCRHAERSDIPQILKLIKCKTLDTFPDAVHPGIIFDRACLSLVQENEAQQLVSAMFLCKHPNILAILPSEWPHWMNQLYGVENSTEMNTLFVHFLVWDERYERDFLSKLLTATFYTHASTTYVVLVQPPSIEPASVISKELTRVAPKNEANEVEAQVLYVGSLRQYLPPMEFRLVVEEDNDDVIQILDADCTRLREFYGDFYISEMMRHPTESRKIIVAEKENAIAAAMCLNGNVDLELLNEKFDLAAFANLKKIPDRKTRVDESGEKQKTKAENDSLENNADDNIENIPKENAISNGMSEKPENLDDKVKDNESIENHESYEDEGSEEDSFDETPVSDAFALELLGHRECIDELKSRELLVAGFECYPDRDYCLALNPTHQPHFPFLDNFVQVPLKYNRDFPMALYLTHRAVFQGKIRVREALETDYNNIAQLLDGVAARCILHDFKHAMKPNARHRSYVFTCDEVIVGVAILWEENEVDLLRRYYRVEDLVPRLEKDATPVEVYAGRLLRLALMPIFNVRLGFLLGEIMRLEGWTILYQRMIAHVCDTRDRKNTISPCLLTMQSVEPRIRNWTQFKRYYQEEDEALPFDNLFSLFMLTPRLTMRPKEIVNRKIVVVGASDCGLSFVDSLALGFQFRDIRFADITLISRNGHPHEHSCDFTVRKMLPFKGRFCHAYRMLTPGRTNYNVVRGTVVAIDRKHKCVHIEDLGSLAYDYLILTFGFEFKKPSLKKDLQDKNFCEEDESELIIPSNCFLINDDYDAEHCLKEIRRITKNYKVKKSIVFHGYKIECYCALGALLDSGLEGTWITLIEPKYLAHDDMFIDNVEIKQTLREIILANGVTVFSDYDLVDWTIEGEDVGIVKSLLVETESADQKLITCDALLSFQTKGPCIKTFLAISRAGLVFDGRLVIDGEFRTNDQYVFAAGKMTKYTGKLSIAEMAHGYHNSIEVGQKLAETLVNILNDKDNERVLGATAVKKLEAKLPNYTFRMPIIVTGFLPGGYRYLHLRKPGPKSDKLDNKTKAESRGDVFTTGSCTADTGYFRLRLNQFRMVESVTCFSKTDFDIQSIIALYGRHETLLNDLKTRFLNGEIDDFYAYFREPWAAAFFHDDYDDFRGERKCCCSDEMNLAECKKNMLDDLTSVLANYNYEKISTEDRVEIMAEYLEKSCYLQEIEDGLIEFLERREDELPMYRTERRERFIRREIDDTPLIYPDYNGRESQEECRECI